MSADYARTGFARRIASLIYDGLVVIAFAMLTTVVYLLVVQGAISLGWLSLGEAEDVAALIQQNTVLYVLRDVLLVLVSLSFLATSGVRVGKQSVCVHGVCKCADSMAVFQAFGKAHGVACARYLA